MSSSLYFSIPTTTWKPFTFSPRRKSASRKRKRDKEAEDHDENDTTSSSTQEILVTSSSAQRSYSKPRVIHSPDDIAQFKAAGHSITEPVPERPFPHRDARIEQKQHQSASSDEQGPQHGEEGEGEADEEEHGIPRGRTLRQQHMGVLTTILYRCVLQKDFARARRAFGLLLREEIGGQAVDIRTGGRWGLGAEILMHADEEKTSMPPIPTILTSNHSEVGGQDGILWNSRHAKLGRSNFELTKRYLESLSVQYAYNSSYPRAFSAIDFKLAMFELWIYMLQEEYHKASDEHNDPPTRELDDTFTDDLMFDRSSFSNTPSSKAPEILINEAREIRHQLETLMQAPIYSNRSDYLNLFKGVTHWVADLEMRRSQRCSPGAESSHISEDS